MRDKAFSALSAHLVNSPEMSELDYMKLWKGLFYCFWMSDKPLIQQDFAEKLCAIIHDLERPVVLHYLKALWKTLLRDWYQIDGIRLNKYYMFLRKLHQNTFMWLSKANWNSDDIKDIQNVLKLGPLRY